MELKSFIVLYNGKFIRAYNENEADKVIAGKDAEIRKLRKALYKACANWAHEAKFDYDDDFGLWYDMEHKCLEKAKEYE